MAERRAGGHIDRDDGRGWVLDDAPAPAAPEPAPAAPEPEPEPEPAPVVPAEPEAEPAEAPAEEPVAEPEPEPSPTEGEVRAWAREVGIDVPTRGRLSKQIVDQYLNREI